MWIIPSNLPLSSASALEFLESKEDLAESALSAELLPMWKSSHSSLRTWSQRWNKVYWLPHLFGRMLKPSMDFLFVERYTALLEVIHAPENRSPGYEKGIFIKDSFGRLYAELSQQQNLFGAFSKTWTTTLRERIQLYNAAYEIWVTQLRQESILRRKQELHMRGNGYSSSVSWSTPTVMATRKNMDIQEVLRIQKELKARKKNGNGFGLNLFQQVRMWQKDPVCGQCHKDSNNLIGRQQGSLNPEWVAQLMGTTLQKTFFVHTATPWSSKPQKSLLEI